MSTATTERTLDRIPRSPAPPRPPVRTPGAKPAAPGPVPGGHWGLPLAVVVIGMFMSVLDTSIVNVAVPAMEKAFNVSAEDIQWVATAYTLCLGVIVPTSAWLGTRVGLRRLYVWSLAGFALFSGL